MSGRIASLAASQLNLSYLYRTQSSLQDLQVQLTSGKVSQTYDGIAKSSQRLVNMENMTSSIENHMKNNDIMNLRLDIASAANTGIKSTLSEFRKSLATFKNNETKDDKSVEAVQKLAHSALLSVEAYLNTSSGGRYVFAGSRTNIMPADLGLTDLAAFQSKYDGASVSVPTTRDGLLKDFSLSADANGQTNHLIFEQDNAASGISAITSLTADYSDLTVGSTIAVTGTANNNATYTVKAITNGGKTVQVETRMLTDEADSTTAVITKPDGSTLKTAQFVDLTFNRAGNSITVDGTKTGQSVLTSLTVGTSFTVSGTTDNNGTYTVAANTGDAVTIVPKNMTDEGVTGASQTLDVNAVAQTFAVNASTDDTISAAAGTYTGLTAGMKVTFSVTASNNATYTVTSVASDGSSINVAETVTAEAAVVSNADALYADGTVAADSYFKGDQVAMSHRMDDKRTFEYDYNAADPAYEKAIRALMIIAQGTFGTEGGLDQNFDRAEKAMWLLDNAVDGATLGTPPYGDETGGSVQANSVAMAYNQVTLKNTKDIHTQITNFLGTRIGEVENVDLLETVTRLQDEQRSLEASYQAMARIRQLSLVNYM